MGSRGCRGWVASGSAVLLLLAASRAADVEARWPAGSNRAVQAADLPATITQALSLRPAADGSVFVGWFGPSHNEVTVQRLRKTGEAAWGTGGLAVRSGRPCFPTGDARIHAGGPMDMLPASDGGLLVAWSEGSGPTRDLRIQRLDAGGAPRFGIGGTTLFTGVPALPAGGWVDSAMAAALSDGKDGLHAAVVTTTGPGAGLRYRHVSGKSKTGDPDADLLLDGSGGDLRYPTLTALPDRSLAALWWNDGTLRLQVLGEGVPLLADGGVAVRTGAGGGWAAVRATGTAARPLLLVSILTDGGEGRLLLLEADGTVLRDELCFPASTGLLEAPVVATVAGIRDGLPEGIDVRGILPGDPRECVRSVRWPGGHWDGPEDVTPPVPVGSGQTGAVGGPLWFWDLSNGGPGARLVGYRETVVGRDLVPRLGPWMAFCPGLDDGSRIAVGGSWIYLAWMEPPTGRVLAARAAVRKSGKEIPLGPKLGDLRLTAANRLTAALPALRFPRPESEGDLRVLVGGELGIHETYDLTSAQRGPRGAWYAELRNAANGHTAIVTSGYFGKGVYLEADGVAMDPQDRALFLRIVDRGRAVSGTVVLRTLPGGSRTFMAGEEE